MPFIKNIRPILLSAPYGDPETNLENILHYPTGHRTIGLVEITLDNGIKGLGKGYLAVFAPRVFEELIHLLKPYIIRKEVMKIDKIYKHV